MPLWSLKNARWLVVPIAFGGMLTVLFVGRTNFDALFQGHSSAANSVSEASANTQPGERVYLNYEQWVALLQREAKVAAQKQPKRLNVLAGDSISLWFPPELLPENGTWLNQGISGETSYGLLKRLALFDQTQPETIFLMIGINDLAKDIRRVTVVENQREIVQYLKRMHPKARIVMQSILPHGGSRLAAQPHTDTTPRWAKRFSTLPNKEIQALNDRLKLVAQEENVEFLDLFPYFLDTSGNLAANLTTDGLHLSRAGYEVWRSRLYAFDATLFPAKATLPPQN